MEFLKSSLLTLAGTLLFGLTLSLSANALNQQNNTNVNHGRQLGNWQQDQGQGIGQLNACMNQDQRECKPVEHKPHSIYHEDQYMGGSIHHDRQHIETTNTIKTTTSEEVENRTNGCTDTEEWQKKIEKKCAPCDK
ncbi:MAG TPA: hypothetical protein VEK06_03010 [Myxococcota bacterium]|nr:hypothetical protein [Myxococcota bacterium]